MILSLVLKSKTLLAQNAARFPEAPKLPKVSNIKEFLSFLVSSKLQEQVFPIKVAFMIISLLFLIVIVYFLIKSSFLEKKIFKKVEGFLSSSPLGGSKAKKKWEKNKKLLESNIQEDWKSAAVGSFNLFDKILEKMGYQGETLSDKVEKLDERDIPSAKEVLKYIEKCEDIIQDPDYELKKSEAKEIINHFEQVLKELQII